MIQALRLRSAAEGYKEAATNFTLPFLPQLSNNSEDTHGSIGHSSRTRRDQPRY